MTQPKRDIRGQLEKLAYIHRHIGMPESDKQAIQDAMDMILEIAADYYVTKVPDARMNDMFDIDDLSGISNTKWCIIYREKGLTEWELFEDYSVDSYSFFFEKARIFNSRNGLYEFAVISARRAVEMGLL